MRTKQMMLVTLGCLLLWTATAAVASQHIHSPKVGKKGEITLTQPTKVGDTVLQPDTCLVQHRTSGNDHFVRFLELKKVIDWGEVGSMTYAEPNNAAEVKCRMEPAAAPLKKTMVSIVHDKSGGDRIAQVVIKGEDFVHIF